MFIIGLTFLVPNQPVTSYLTLQLKSLGFDTFTTNLLTIPAYCIFIVNLLFWTWVYVSVLPLSDPSILY